MTSAFNVSDISFALLLMVTVSLIGCSAQQTRSAAAGEPGAGATSRAEDNGRILVTVEAKNGRNAALLSPSGRLDYIPPSPATIQARQLSVARRLAEYYDLQLEEFWPIPALDIYCLVFRLDDPTRKPEVLARLDADTEVESVQPLQFFYTAAVPPVEHEALEGDPLSGWDEGLKQRLLEAHRFATGKSVRIAVIDTGIDLDHEDLKGASITAHDFVDDLSLPPPETHGTAVTGLLLARMANNVGIRGYTPDADILLLRSCWEPEKSSERAVCNTFTLAKALSYALASDAAIVNLSISGPRDPLLERIAAKFADNKQLLVVAGESNKRFPASVPHSLVAMDQPMSRKSARMMTLLPGNRYGLRGGSSMAAARLTGIVALMKQLKPQLSLPELRQQLGPPPLAAAGGLQAVTQLLWQGIDNPDGTHEVRDDHLGNKVTD